jgi:hypothetical protein
VLTSSYRSTTDFRQDVILRSGADATTLMQPDAARDTGVGATFDRIVIDVAGPFPQGKK